MAWFVLMAEEGVERRERRKLGVGRVFYSKFSRDWGQFTFVSSDQGQDSRESWGDFFFHF